MKDEEIKKAAKAYAALKSSSDVFKSAHENDFEAGAKHGRLYLTDITHRNYEATKRRGLITEDTLMWDFCEKMYEEVDELRESNPTDFSELADITLVCFAMAEHYGIDLIEEMRKKTEFNETRV